MGIRKISVIFFLGASTLYFAQSSEDTLSGETAVDEVTIIGTRNKKRTIINTPVPVDLIDVKQISQSTGQVDVNQLLQFAAPSFNSNKQSGSDGADAVDPATLRGLGAEQILTRIPSATDQADPKAFPAILQSLVKAETTLLHM